MANLQKNVELVALDRVKYLYEYFGISERAVVLEGEFGEKIIEQIKLVKASDESILKEKMEMTMKFYENELGIL